MTISSHSIAILPPLATIVLGLVITPDDVAVVIIATSALVTAIGTAIANVMASRRVEKKLDLNTAVTQSVEKKADVIEKKADVIEGHVNSAASVSKTEIDGLRAEIQMLRDVMANQKEIAALLAQSAAVSGTKSPPSAVIDTPPKETP